MSTTVHGHPWKYKCTLLLISLDSHSISILHGRSVISLWTICVQCGKRFNIVLNDYGRSQLQAQTCKRPPQTDEPKEGRKSCDMQRFLRVCRLRFCSFVVSKLQWAEQRTPQQHHPTHRKPLLESSRGLDCVVFPPPQWRRCPKVPRKIAKFKKSKV